MHNGDNAISWEEKTEPHIEDILVGIELGYYRIEGDAMVQVCDQKIREIFQSDRQMVDGHSLAVGFLMGQVGERLKQRERS